MHILQERNNQANIIKLMKLRTSFNIPYAINYRSILRKATRNIF